MKKLFLILVLVSSLFLFSFNVLAGDMKVNVNNEETETEMDFDEFDQFDVDVEGLKGNGGMMIGVLQLDLTELNEQLTAVTYGGTGFNSLDGDIVIFGGGGLGGFKKGSRFGGFGVQGTTQSTGQGDKKAVLEISYGGFLFENGIVATEKTDIAVGAVIGGGTANLNLLYEKPGSEVDFNTPINNHYKKDYILLQPRVNIHQQLGMVVGVDLTLGYLLTYDFGKNWELGGQTVNGPLANFQGPTATIGLNFGF